MRRQKSEKAAASSAESQASSSTSTTCDDKREDQSWKDFGMGSSKRWGVGDARAVHAGVAGGGGGAVKAGAGAPGGGSERSDSRPGPSFGSETKGVPVTTRTVSRSSMDDAATVIQYHFSVNAKLRELVQMRRKVKRRLRSLVVYLVFVAAYTYSTVKPISSEDIFWFQENLKDQFTTVEFRPEHSPTFGKTFTDVATVQEWNQWLLGPFLGTAYSTGTFDGDLKDPFDLARHVLGYGRKLGGIRIGQLRTRRRNCTSQIGIPELTTNTTEPFYCYGDALSMFTEGEEDTVTFGRGREKFTWAGWNNSDTRVEREAYLTTELLKPRYVANKFGTSTRVGNHMRGRKSMLSSLASLAKWWSMRLVHAIGPCAWQRLWQWL